MFIYYNPTHLQQDIYACIPRAFTCAFDEEYQNEYRLKAQWRSLLLDADFEYKSITAKPFQKRMTVKKLSEICNKNSVIICSTGNHVVCIKNNNYYDITDTGEMCVFFYFERRNDLC